MIRWQNFVVPSLLLIVTLQFVRIYPSWTILWAVLFLVCGYVSFLISAFANLFYLDRLYCRGKFERLRQLCSRSIHKSRNKTVSDVAKVYLAASLLAIDQKNNLDEAMQLMADVDTENLSPRFLNRLRMFKAFTFLYSEQPQKAFEELQQASLANLNPFFLCRMFYVFSLVFTVLKRDQERAERFASQCHQFETDNPLFAAQLGLSLCMNKDVKKGRKLLELAHKIEDSFVWEKQFYLNKLQQFK